MALVLAQFRGYDMLDGAYYYLVYRDPADDTDTHTRFNLLGRPIWMLCGQNIVAFRVACLGALSAAAVFFWLRWRRLSPGANAPASSLLALWLAAMAGLCWVPVALTYNSLATLFALVGLGVLAALLDDLRGGAGGRWGAGALLAAASAGLLLVKPPAALAFFAGVWFLCCFDAGIPVKARRRLFWWPVLAGALLAAGTIWAALRPGFDSRRLFYIGGLALSPAWVAGSLQRYAAEIARLLPELRRDFAWTIGPMALAVAVAAVPARDSPRARRWLAAALALLLAALLGAFLKRRLWDGSFTSAVGGNAARFYLLAWGSLLPLWLASLWRSRGRASGPGRRPAAWAWIPVLLALPLCGSLGTTNTLYVAALHQTILWAAGLLLVSSQIAAGLQLPPWFRAAVTAGLCAGAACHLFTGQFWRPYMFQPPLWRQTEVVEVGSPPTALKLDPALARFLAEVRGALETHGYRPGDDVFGFFNLPGVIFAVGAREPGAPWYFGTWYHQDDTDGGKLRRVPLERRQRAWIITQADVRPFRPRFLECGIDFPNGYTMIGHTISPTSGLEIGIWKPLPRH